MDFSLKPQYMLMADILKTGIMRTSQDLPFLRQRTDLLRLLGKITFLDLIFCLLTSTILSSPLKLLLNKCPSFPMLTEWRPILHLMVNLRLIGLKKVSNHQAIERKSHAPQMRQCFTTQMSNRLLTIGITIMQLELRG